MRPTFLEIHEAAAELSVCPKTVQKMIRNKELKYVKFKTSKNAKRGIIRIPFSAIEDMKRKCEG